MSLKLRKLVTLLFPFGLFMAAPETSQAQFAPFYGNSEPFLTKGDFTFTDAAAHKLMDPQPAPFGTAVAWNNTGSGNSGVITMGRAYQKNGFDCRTVIWHDLFREGFQRTVMLDTCHISGAWKLM